VLADIAFEKYLKDFSDQLIKERGPLEVFNPLGSWPNSLHFLTNYGVLILDFPVDLTSEKDIQALGINKALVPSVSRLI
jgi:hypothetical protein